MSAQHGSEADEKSVLVIGPSWIGDMVMAQSLFRQLRMLHPKLRLDVLAPAWSGALLARMPEVDEALDLPFAHGELNLRQRYRLGRKLSQRNYDQVIVLPNSFKSALIPWFAEIPQRTGWRGEMRGWILNDCRHLDKKTMPLMVQRFVALASAAGTVLPDPLPVPQLKINRADVTQVLADLGLPCNKTNRMLVLCPGAEYGDAKQWPAEYYAAVAVDYLDKSVVRSNVPDTQWQVVLLGSARDRGITDEIEQHLSPLQRARCHNLAGSTSLGQAIDLMSAATAVVSNDSGLMHIAAALHRPLVALYGSTSAEFTPPLSDQVELLHTDIDCRPCFKRQCPYGHKRCLTELLPARVLAALDRLQHTFLIS
jgi:heptosyltransferase II